MTWRDLRHPIGSYFLEDDDDKWLGTVECRSMKSRTYEVYYGDGNYRIHLGQWRFEKNAKAVLEAAVKLVAALEERERVKALAVLDELRATEGEDL